MTSLLPAEDQTSTLQTVIVNYVTPVTPALPTTTKLPHTTVTTKFTLDFHRNLNAKTLPKHKSFSTQIHKEATKIAADVQYRRRIQQNNNSSTNIGSDVVTKVHAPKEHTIKVQLDHTKQVQPQPIQIPLNIVMNNGKFNHHNYKPKENYLGDLRVVDKSKHGHHYDYKPKAESPISDIDMHELINPSKRLNGGITFNEKHYQLPLKVDGLEPEPYFLPEHNAYNNALKPAVGELYVLESKPHRVPIPLNQHQPYFTPNNKIRYSVNQEQGMDHPNKQLYLGRTKPSYQLRNKELNPIHPESHSREARPQAPVKNNNHVSVKLSNPYETVLLRPVERPGPIARKNINPQSMNSPLDVERLVHQMEVETEVNRNLERSADKSQDSAAGQ